MGVMDVTAESLAAMFKEIGPHLDERQRRLLMGAQARALGHGGIRLVAGAAGVREATVSLGAAELASGAEPLGRARRPGGGARRARDKDPGLVPALLALVEPEERGDPESPLRWTVKSTRNLAGELTRQGRKIGADTVRVRDHSFPDEELGVVIPYGIYDLAANTGWVNAGTDHDTAAFAIESVRRWWNARGRADYPAARRLLVTADAGGSNGYRTRAWTAGLAALAAETGLAITCCHFPPGTSKWNKVEHRLFSAITLNWRGRPLTSHAVVLQSIAAATTATGLTVTAALDEGRYPTGTKVSDEQMTRLEERALTRHGFRGAWNYTARPPLQGPAPRPGPAATPSRAAQVTAALDCPALTGMSRQDLAALAAALQTPFDAAREQPLYAHRGGPRRVPGRAGTPYRGTLGPAARLLATRAHPAPVSTPARGRRHLRRPPEHHQPRRHDHPRPARQPRNHHRARTGQAPHHRRLLPLRQSRRNRPPRHHQTNGLIICEHIAGPMWHRAGGGRGRRGTDERREAPGA